MSWRDVAIWLGSERYAAAVSCLTNDGLIVLLYTICDVASGISYGALGAALSLSSDRGLQTDGDHRLLLGLMLLFSGARQFSEVAALHVGIYRLDIVIKAACTAVAVVAALTMARGIITKGRVPWR